MPTQTVPQQNNDASLQSPSMFLRSIRLKNLLSFGADTSELLLEQLNILIGPNGCGKSNFIEAISLLRATPSNIQEVLRKGGGVREWIHKGSASPSAAIDILTAYRYGRLALRHLIEFLPTDHYASILSERLEEGSITQEVGRIQQFFDLDFRSSPPSFFLMGKRVQPSSLDFTSSILAQRRDPEQYPEITLLADWYSRIRIYREWAFGRNTVLREPQRTDMRTDRLEEDFSNLGLFLNRLRRNPQAKREMLEHLRDIYDGVDDFDVSIQGGTVQVFLTEGAFVIPATRLSDGTLRYLCLLAILCDPTPPPLICIEEPELGLHPDILPKLADLLVAASERTQLIVTTHSSLLVDAMTKRPESVIVFEKHQGQTEMTRLSTEDLKDWLESYRLGELWARGDLGGTRW